jgi:hypothetical protein
VNHSIARDTKKAIPTRTSITTGASVLHLSQIMDLPLPWAQYRPNDRPYEELIGRNLRAMGVADTDSTRFHTISSVPKYFHPRASERGLILSLEILSLEMNLWFFYFDDMFDDDKTNMLGSAGRGENLTDRMIGVLETGILPDDPSVTEKLCQKFRERSLAMCQGREATWRRHIGYCIDWTRSVLPFARVQRARALPDLETYRQMRMTNIGLYPLISFNEIDGGLTVGPDFIGSREIRRMDELAFAMVMYCNDIYSYEKESRQWERPFNSLFLRQHHYHMTLEEAVERQLEDISTTLTEFNQIEIYLTGKGILGEVAQGDDSDSARTKRCQNEYVRGLKEIIMGNHLWSINGGRYSSPTSPFQELRTAW